MGYLVANRMSRSHLATDVETLSKGYTPGRRAMDTIVIVLFFVLEAFVLYRSLPFIGERSIVSAVIAFIGYLAADFMSGLVHWIGDTWGNPSMPIVGQYFIRPFREHHVDQMAITRHNFTETNGANSLATMVVLLPTVLLLYGLRSPFVLGFHFFAFAMSMGVFGTNQFHKWSHLSEQRRPWLIRQLQGLGVILRPAHHAKHHAAPYDHHYCITVGWLNPVLAKIQFFRVVEKVIQKITGAIPRKNDIVLTATKTASKAVAKVEGVIGGVKEQVGGAIGEVKHGVTGAMGEVGEVIDGAMYPKSTNHSSRA